MPTEITGRTCSWQTELCIPKPSLDERYGWPVREALQELACKLSFIDLEPDSTPCGDLPIMHGVVHSQDWFITTDMMGEVDDRLCDPGDL